MTVMPEEIFDVVNEQDEVVDTKPRSEVHRMGLLHRAVHALVYNSKGEVFLQKRSMIKDSHPGRWDSSASGHVDTGENYDQTVIREIAEELGLKIESVPEKLFKIDARAETDQEFVWVYRLQHEGPFTLHPEEIESGEWMEPAFVSKWISIQPERFAPAFNYIWEKIAALKAVNQDGMVPEAGFEPATKGL